MKIQSLIIAAGFVFAAATGTVMAQSAAESTMVSDPYVRAVPPGQPNSASFLTLMNNSSEAHSLVGAESPAAKVVELHTHTMENGMMQMRQVEKIDLPAGETVSLQPGGLHIMMIELTQELVPGQDVDITLKFEDGSEAQVKAPVKKLQMKMMKKDDGAMKHMKH